MSVLDAMDLTAQRTPGGYVDGVWVVSGAPTEIPFVGSRPQPIGPEFLERLDEGAREGARYATYVEADQPELKLVAPGTIDVMEWRGETYQLLSDEDWANGVPLAHHAYALIEVTLDE